MSRSALFHLHHPSRQLSGQAEEPVPVSYFTSASGLQFSAFSLRTHEDMGSGIQFRMDLCPDYRTEQKPLTFPSNPISVLDDVAHVSSTPHECDNAHSRIGNYLRAPIAGTHYYINLSPPAERTSQTQLICPSFPSLPQPTTIFLII